jgi:hypothetical protein
MNFYQKKIKKRFYGKYNLPKIRHTNNSNMKKSYTYHYLFLYILSLIIFNPLISLGLLLVTGCVYEYTILLKWLTIFTTIYCIFGFRGILISLMSVLYFSYCLMSTTGLFNKVQKFKSNGKPKMMNKINELKSLTSIKYNSYKTVLVNYLNNHHSKWLLIVNGCDKVKYVCTIVFDISTICHDIFYKSNYNIYVNLCDYIYLFYTFINFIILNIKMLGKNKTCNNIRINKINKKPDIKIKNRNEAFKILHDINSTLSSISTLSSVINNLDENYLDNNKAKNI